MVVRAEQLQEKGQTQQAEMCCGFAKVCYVLHYVEVAGSHDVNRVLEHGNRVVEDGNLVLEHGTRVLRDGNHVLENWLL